MLPPRRMETQFGSQSWLKRHAVSKKAAPYSTASSGVSRPNAFAQTTWCSSSTNSAETSCAEHSQRSTPSTDSEAVASGGPTRQKSSAH
eukprot:3000611-Prymnesium_polylepis.1